MKLTVTDQGLFIPKEYLGEAQELEVIQEKAYSFTDCLSFIVMQNREILSALTLDRHFYQAGFEILP